jgi:UDP-N-acetylglucosamine transferase subunit ALG13
VSAPKVVVSAGTDIHPFERLMDWVERWIAVDPQRASVWVQHGTSRLPQGAEGAELTSQEEMRRLMSEADIVILQGGPGGMIDAWVCGQRPVVVPRVHDLGEHVDNHQVAFARHMAAQDQIDVAEDEATLHALLDAACAQPGSRRIEPYVVQSSETAARVGSLVEDLVRSGRR